jgi:hypothetical protein
LNTAKCIELAIGMPALIASSVCTSLCSVHRAGSYGFVGPLPMGPHTLSMQRLYTHFNHVAIIFFLLNAQGHKLFVGA